jgi:uncharacterized membrane protein (UPF0127 family)
MIHLIDHRTGMIIVEKLIVRSTFSGRLRGFAYRKIPAHDTAMLFLNTKRIHTIGMFFPLDIHYFDDSMYFLESMRHVPPNTIPASPIGTRHILEVPVMNSKSILFRKREQVSLVFGVKR